VRNRDVQLARDLAAEIEARQGGDQGGVFL
jgi:hypothetical protein